MEFWNNLKNEFMSPERIAINIVDVVLCAFLLYAVFVFLKKNNASRLIKFVLLFLVVSLVITSGMLNMRLLGNLFSLAIVLLVLALGVLFPQEVRRGLWKFASPKEAQETFNTQYDCSDAELKEAIDNIVRAAQNMAKKDIGALIVIAPEEVPPHILESGTRLDAVLSCPLMDQ